MCSGIFQVFDHLTYQTRLFNHVPGMVVKNVKSVHGTHYDFRPSMHASQMQGDLEPAWSPGGVKIAFRSGRDGNGEIYVMNADGTGQARRWPRLERD